MLIRNQEHILVIDDDPLNIEMISSVALATDRKLHVAKTLSDALRIIDKQVITLVLLDLFLPDGDGRAVLRHLKEFKHSFEIPVIVLTVSDSPVVRQECIDLGAVGFFTKPLQLTRLQEAINKQLKSHGAAQDTNAPIPKSLQAINLRSRPEFIEDYAQHTKIAQTNHQEFWLGITSVDNVSTFSTNLTAQQKERILQRLLLTVALTVKDNGFCARWGEGEFLTLFPNLPIRAVIEIHRQIRSAAKEINSQIFPEAKSEKLELSTGLADVSGIETLNEGLDVVGRFLLAARSETGEKIVHSQLPISFPDRKILIVDDDPVISGMIDFRLQREGFQTFVASNGVDGWSDAVKHEPDLITLDVKMPMMDGFELLKKLRNDTRFSKTPILMLTTQGNEKDVTRGFELGASDYMIKPFSPSELLVRVRRLMMNSIST